MNHPNNTKEIFQNIYKKDVWNNTGLKEEFFSGPGSRDLNIITPYIQKVKSFLNEKKTDQFIAVDLGCGDFNIGSQIYTLFKKYIACDIVPELIDFNKKKFSNTQVIFQTLDMCKDDLPHGDIVFIRQVFQHLSNTQIQNVLDKVKTSYEHLIVTEHIPSKEFVSNKEISSIGWWRLPDNSGVVVTDPPFNFKAEFEYKICEAYPKHGGIIVSTYYKI